MASTNKSLAQMDKSPDVVGPTCSFPVHEASKLLENATMNVEIIRARYRPDRITTLFVGESAPESGAFFYYGNSALTHQMETALTANGLGGNRDFLERFMSYGWYLDDLVLTPVNHLPKAQREAQCIAAVHSLADRIAEYRPLGIVSVLLKIKDIVGIAAKLARSDAVQFAVPFPGNGQQARFQREMARILPRLPIAS
jgi:hypothetical protein